ncbi:hypothetical protein ACFO9Q_22350 [Paenibacillus sp. GCM10023252]|uniref:hypothetical protein n=1 Tax=Paenibacillus sp. GCM10023252 TaxID=3252649 RepID=UPI0036149B22
MSQSKTRKARQKLARQGKLTPDTHRGQWNGVHPVTRTTPTLQQRKQQLHTKYRRNLVNDSHDSFSLINPPLLLSCS